MIYVIRHGQTDWNLERRMQGRSGLPLNDEGVKQAHKLKEELQHINFDYVFSSPQQRAVQTAEIISGMSAVTDERLDVFDLGEADGLKRSDTVMAGSIPDRKIYQGVEEPDKFVSRVFSFVKELETSRLDSKANILICGHRCTTGCIGAYFNGIPEDGNILRFSSDTGDYKKYAFTQK